MKLFWSLSLLCLCSCAYLPQRFGYRGPAARPTELDQYYSRGQSFQGIREEYQEDRGDYELKTIWISTQYGDAKLDLYSRKEKSNTLILVFPILGGKYWFEKYFADYFARRGFDAAIVRRNNDFKDPKNFHRIEDVLREGVVRDRVMLDALEQVYGKKRFGSFGLSRGAINAAILAGVDPRLQHNVLVMGASDIPKVMRRSDQPGLDKFRRKVKEHMNFESDDQFYEHLEREVKTDPKYLAKYIDANKTLMVLAVFDDTVPFKYGMRLRRAIGYPDTAFLVANHYTGLLYTQFVKLLLPFENACLFPLDYVETESLAFYRRAFEGKKLTLAEIPYLAAKVPFAVFNSLQCLFKEECRKTIPTTKKRLRLSRHS